MMFVAIIPARYASTRFPGKPLADINGMSMIERVYNRAKEAKSISRVIVATDDERIADCVKKFGGEVIITDVNHQSGTDRCAEVAQKIGLKNDDIVINVQGDEPYIDAAHIDELTGCFQNEKDELATLVSIIKSEEDIENPNVVKAILNKNNEAIYFSRAAIPHNRNAELLKAWLKQGNYYKHIGIYGYRVGTLLSITQLKKSFLELTESLEQLRWIENGYKIKVKVVPSTTYTAIDSPADIELLLKQLKEGI
jgi:3-deoxy-manno-octulosonate cytidylyltransferase (CMP-KDO synthetase)